MGRRYGNNGGKPPGRVFMDGEECGATAAGDKKKKPALEKS
jgi:hypothetical protein